MSKKDINHNVLKKSLEDSKIFKWLINKLKKQENNEIYFGKLSSIIHNSLLDDPKPYRKGVKDLQINLYSFLKKIKFNNLEVSVPFAKSEKIKLLMNK